MDYAWEKLFTAVLNMARSTSSIQERLAHAYVDNLIHIRPEQQLPPELREKFAEVEAAMHTRKAQGGEGDAMASALALDEMEARDVIEKVVSLFNSVTKRLRDD